MKKFLLFVALFYTMTALANAQQRPNEKEIWYTTTDEQIVNPYKVMHSDAQFSKTTI